MILHIPHTSTFTGTIISDHLLESVDLMTDWYADDLFGRGSKPFESLVFDHSRLVVDVERFVHDDLDKHGKGYIYKTDAFGSPISRCGKIEDDLYNNHYLNLVNLVYKWQTLFPIALIVDCHTFNDKPLPWEKEGLRPDICIGTNPFSTPPHIAELLLKHFLSHDLSVEFNSPYSGTIIPECFSGDKNVWSIMIEVNKRLYLNYKYKKNSNFDNLRYIIRGGLDIINEYQDRQQDEFYKHHRQNRQDP